MGRPAPGWVAFDLNGTLLDVGAIAGALPDGLGDPEALVAAAFHGTIEGAMATTMVGRHPPFPDLLRASLARELARAGRPPDDAVLDRALARAAALPAYPEAGAALDHLRAAGLRLAVVTNSATAAAERALREAGLRERLDAVVGTDRAGAFKPDPRVYANGLRALGVTAGDVVMVAAHWWDLLGAGAAGMRTAWVARKERVLVGTLPTPDHRGEDLLEVARAIAGG
jgi:2-haloacid dehalogenase